VRELHLNLWIFKMGVYWERVLAISNSKEGKQKSWFEKNVNLITQNEPEMNQTLV
jgi:hypothetical protein